MQNYSNENKFSFFEEINVTHDPKDLLDFLAEKLKNYPPSLVRKSEKINGYDIKNEQEFRIMQWNILAKALCSPNPFVEKSADTYDWEKYRKWRTLEEIVRHDCDIVCLQEADVYEYIKPYLHSIGYTSVFYPKFSSPCLEKMSNVGPDGSAIFYKLSKFQILNMGCEKIAIDNEIQSQTFIILNLLHKKSGKCLTVVSLHLKASDNYYLKREKQMIEIMNCLKKHLDGSFHSSFNSYPVLICGDFNGQPDEKFYHVIQNDKDLKLRDAYSIDCSKKQPTVYYVDDSDGSSQSKALDYIFFTPSTLQLTEYLKLPEIDLSIEKLGLPNLSHSSDHFSLVANFAFLN